MIGIAKISEEAKFRKDMFKAKRKPSEEMVRRTGDRDGYCPVCSQRLQYAAMDRGAYRTYAEDLSV